MTKEDKEVQQSEAPEVKKVVENDESEQKIAELTNDLQRTRADFENYRRQVELQKEQYGNVVKNTTVMKILPLLDDLDRAIAVNESLKPLEKSLEKTLKELKLERIDSAANTPFNPDLHDAIMVSGDGEKELVAETLRAGYRYEGEVIRPALVKVDKQ